jgi:hypothetical protein
MPVLLPARLQALHVLAWLAVPVPPRLVVQVHAAFFPASDLTTGALARLLRDDERSYRAGAPPVPYHLCPALTAARLAPAYGLVALSAWPLERRVVGPLSRRADTLAVTARVADEAARRAGASALVTSLLRDLAVELPGSPFDVMRPELAADAARAALAGCAGADARARAAAAARARAELTPAERLFGTGARDLIG